MVLLYVQVPTFLITLTKLMINLPMLDQSILEPKDTNRLDLQLKLQGLRISHHYVVHYLFQTWKMRQKFREINVWHMALHQKCWKWFFCERLLRFGLLCIFYVKSRTSKKSTVPISVLKKVSEKSADYFGRGKLFAF